MSEQEPKKQWNIQIPTPEDAEAMAHMQATAWVSTYLRPGQDERNEQVEDHAAAYKLPERIIKRVELIESAKANTDKEFYRIVKADDEIIGLLYGTKTEENQELVLLYVADEYQRQGVGEQLTQAFIDWCDPDLSIELGVVDDNERAIGFYERMGFQAIQSPRHKFSDYLHEIEMRRLPPKGENI